MCRRDVRCGAWPRSRDRLEGIRLGLCTFDNTFEQTPGRMNIYDQHPFRVIVDYAHNPVAVRTMCGLVDRLGAERREDRFADGSRRPS